MTYSLLNENQTDYNLVESNDYSTFSLKNELLLKGKNSIIVTACVLSLSQSAIARSIVNTMDSHETFIESYDKHINTPLDNYIEQTVNARINTAITIKDLVTQIISFKSLVNNWDGYGAIPTEVESATNTILIINSFNSEILPYINEIYPNPHGTISILCKNEANEIISIEIGNQTFSYYVEFLSREVQYFEKNQINIKNIEKLSSYILAL